MTFTFTLTFHMWTRMQLLMPMVLQYFCTKVQPCKELLDHMCVKHRYPRQSKIHIQY